LICARQKSVGVPGLLSVFAKMSISLNVAFWGPFKGKRSDTVDMCDDGVARVILAVIAAVIASAAIRRTAHRTIVP
jgi:hypothetical protein